MRMPQERADAVPENAGVVAEPLIDRYMPRSEVSEVHETVVRAFIPSNSTRAQIGQFGDQALHSRTWISG
jgi:hypothetical protein